MELTDPKLRKKIAKLTNNPTVLWYVCFLHSVFEFIFFFRLISQAMSAVRAAEERRAWGSQSGSHSPSPMRKMRVVAAGATPVTAEERRAWGSQSGSRSPSPMRKMRVVAAGATPVIEC